MVGNKATAGYAGTRLRSGEKAEKSIRKVTAEWRCVSQRRRSVRPGCLRRLSDGFGAETRAPNLSAAYQAIRTALFCKFLESACPTFFLSFHAHVHLLYAIRQRMYDLSGTRGRVPW